MYISIRTKANKCIAIMVHCSLLNIRGTMTQCLECPKRRGEHNLAAVDTIDAGVCVVNRFPGVLARIIKRCTALRL